MTITLLEQAFQQVATLPEQEQARIAAWILDELQDEREWDAQFAASPDALSRLADEALAEHRARKTQPFERARL